LQAEGLKKAPAALGYEIRVETQGSVGAKNVLTDEEIAAADVAIIAADAFVDKTRFENKRLYETGTKPALSNGQAVIKTALELPEPVKGNLAEQVKNAKSNRSQARTGPYKHLMTGVSYMLPIVVAGGLMIAISFAIGGIHGADQKGTLAWALMEIGGGTAFKLFIPIFSAFIAYSIANRPGITSGLIGGMLATTINAGFLGGILSGFFAGYVTLALTTYIKLPENLEGIKPVLILPLFSTLIVGLGMIYVIGPPIAFIMEGLTNWLMGLQNTSAILLGALLGAMMAFDMGGPVNKAAYTVSVGLLASNIYQPMAATMAAGMTPPLALGLAATLFKSRFTEEERRASKPALVLGVSFITEGAIPFAAADPLRVIPCTMIGSAVAGAISMVFKCGLLAPHGGMFVLAVPNAIQHLGIYIIAILAGTIISTAALYLVKKPIETVAA
jgi:fructose PTS system EIIBC or EIIC component